MSDKATSILICDDSEAVRALVTEIVGSDPGMRVVGEAKDGNEVVVQAIRLQPDVIILDLAMPNRSGLEALPELRRSVPQARVIVFSGFAGDAVEAEVMALGAVSYLEKGANPARIVATIERVAAEHAAGQNGNSPAASGVTLPGDSGV
jgi:DNA-binding NarL/FixJ family response regulator